MFGGAALLWFMRRVSLPSEALYPLRALAGGLVIFGLASVAHGSGFLAIFVAGIVLGDARAPYKAEVARFVSAVASLGEIVAFVVLGLTVDLATVAHADVWLPGLALAALLAFAVRPLLVGLLMARMDLRRQREGVRALGGPERRGTDPAGHVPAQRPRGGRAAALRRSSSSS